MPSAIDPRYPIFGTPTTVSVRDNFTIARDEITSLQLDVSERLNKLGDIMLGSLELFQDPRVPMEAATMRWVQAQMRSTVNTLIYVGRYNAATDQILSSNTPIFTVGQPLPAAGPTTDQHYFTVVNSSNSAIGNQPSAIPPSSWLISNGSSWNIFTFNLDIPGGISSNSVTISPAIPNVPGTDVNAALTSVGSSLGTINTTLGNLNTSIGNINTSLGADFLRVDGTPASNNLSYVRHNRTWSNQPVFDRITSNNIFRIPGTLFWPAGNTPQQNQTLWDNAPQISFGNTTDPLGQVAVVYETWNVSPGPGVTGSFTIYPQNNEDNHWLTYGPNAYQVAYNPSTPRAQRVGMWQITDILRLSGPESSIWGNGQALWLCSTWSMDWSVGPFIGIKGPGAAAPNQIEIWTGSNWNWGWRFQADGNFVCPSHVTLTTNSRLSFGAGRNIVNDGANNWQIVFDLNYRFWYGASTGSLTFDAFPNYTGTWIMEAGSWAFKAERGPVYGWGFGDYSDERMKHRIKPFNERGLKELLQLQPISYIRSLRTPTEYGFSAQQVEKVIPEFVQPADEDHQYMSISLMCMITLCINAIKDLHKMIGAPVAEAN